MDSTKIIILDRDGVINQDSDSFIKSPDEWIALPGSLEAIARLNQAGYRVVVATNQSGIGRGLFDIRSLHKIHAKMYHAAQMVGAHIDAIFFCPHRADDYCDCRKPKPGMFHSIGKRYRISLTSVPAVGDSLRDLQAAYIAGCKPCLVRSGKGLKTLAAGGLPPQTEIYNDLAHFVESLLKQ